MKPMFTNQAEFSGHRLIIDTYSNNTSRVILYSRSGTPIIQKVIPVTELAAFIKSVSTLIKNSYPKAS